jgi:2-haloalkanoic acid dehalogenase type II
LDISGIEVITFDFYAALMDTIRSLKENAVPILKADPATQNFTREEMGSFVQSWSYQYSSYVTIVDALQENPGLEWASKDLFKMMLNITLEFTCASQEVPLRQDSRHALTETWKNLRPWQNTARVLRALRAAKTASGEPRFRLAALSNGDYEFLRAGCAVLEAEAGVTFDAYFGCDGLGINGTCLFKPAPNFYLQAKALVKDPGADWKSKVLHVAGAPYDANGARAFGYKTVWNSNSTRPVYFDYTGTGKNVPDAVLHEIGELPSVLGVPAEVSDAAMVWM